MIRVYLDQNHWIALTAARLGKPHGTVEQQAGARDVLTLGQAMVEAGDVSFPLSAVHYQETWNRGNPESRRDLALTMANLSLFHAIAWLYDLVDSEIEQAIWEAYGGPRPPAPISPFGVGFAHTGSRSRERPAPYRVPEQFRTLMTEGQAWRLERDAAALREIAVLSGGGTSAGAVAGSPPPAADPSGWQAEAERYAAAQEQLRAERRAEKHDKGEWGTRVFYAEAYAEHLDQINGALKRAGQPAWVVGRRGWEGVTRLIESIPTLHAIAEFRRHRHNGSQKSFEHGDALDQFGLPGPLVYCDIVVTERQHAVKLAKVAERHGTVLLHRLQDLPRHLV